MGPCVGVAVLVLILSACWKVDRETIDMTEIPYENADLTVEARVRMLDLDLSCPDGAPDRLFVLYVPTDAPRAIAIVLHSGAFDYVVEPVDGDALAGEHYQAPSRLGRAWSNDKVWETFGLAPTEVDPPEVNLGTLPTALVNAGFAVLLPGNCWGDLWHGEEGVQEGQPDVDGFQRNGRTAAWSTVEMLDDDRSMPVPWNGELSLVGLGEGGRGVTELLLHEGMPPVDSILVDSSPDDLQPYVDDPILWADEVAGLERIFGDAVTDPRSLSDWTLASAAEVGLVPARVAYLWSSLDPRVPVAAMEGFATLAAGHEGNWVADLAVEQHVLTNADPALAAQAAEYLVSGTVP
jgi:hypothetical protein